MNAAYKVSLVSLKSCLINLPPSITRSLATRDVAAQNVVVTLSQGERIGYAGWTGHSSAKSDTVELDPAYARNVALIEGSEVKIEVKLSPRNAEVVWVEPVSADDWEMMELHASFLEVNLLSQIRAISTKHPLTVYLNAHTTANIVVKKIEPELPDGEAYAKLSTSAEVVVSPKARQTAQDKLPVGRSARSAERVHAKTIVRRQDRTVLLRAVRNESSEIPGLNAFLPSDLFRTAFNSSPYIQIHIILPPALRRKTAPNDLVAPPLPEKNKSLEQIKIASKIVVRAHPSADLHDKQIGLSSSVLRALSAETGSVIRVGLAGNPSKSSAITCHSTLEPASKKKELIIGGKQNEDIFYAFKTQLSSLGEGPITHGLLMDDFVVALQSEGDWMPIPSIDKLTITKGEDILSTIAPITKLKQGNPKAIDVVAKKVEKVCGRHGGVLIFGSRGSGKTCVATHCTERLERNYAHVVTTDCAKLSEERIPVIKESLSRWFSEAAWYEPSVIFIDDLDRLCAAEVEHADSTRARQIAEIFLSIVRQYTSRHAIAILATSQSKEALHSLLTTSHIFDETIALKPPNKLARRDIAQSLVSTDQQDGVDWLEVANITDGYLAGDLKFLTERARHEGLMREMAEGEDTVSDQLKTIDYQKAITGFTPASLRGIKLQKSSVEWKDIGGLEETRRILLETLEWPTRYAPIFANCPLRLRSGLLLYGYPGCGKTLLASAVASECGLNFIAVKGPEILNKYIGASEKSVRDLFDRAQAAKPCVLFFDEFDSIAPKRGHDSTGVTDRVVNQMLTQMDGAEGLEGVYVLAATSRPDLIDPALLRPGRLDKSLLCSMPTHADRVSILEALSRKMHVSADVDLHELAAMTEGFSGADLQAVLYNAHLEAIHTHLAELQEHDEAATNGDQHVRSTGMTVQKQPTTFTRFTLGDAMKNHNIRETRETTPKTSADLAAVTARIESILSNSVAAQGQNSHQEDSVTKEQVIYISWQNLVKSLSTTKPSISVQERRRLDKVYHDFVDGRSADGLPDGQVAPGEQRATLA